MRIARWLYPGLRIKRWLLLICAGIIFLCVGAFSFAFIGLVDPNIVDSLLIDATKVSLLLVIAGPLMIYFGIRRLTASIIGLLRGSVEDKPIVDIAYERRYLQRGPKVVALGGGTGLSNLLSGLKNITADITAVVTVADDGGSSGRLRKDLDMLPPGDIRNCLVSLSDAEPVLADLMQYRFNEGELSGHSFGNLLITVLTKIRGGFGEAVKEANKIMAVRGSVVPATVEMVSLVATHTDGTKSTGQRLISQSDKPIKSLELRPEPREASPEALAAIGAADFIILGPGSLYTSLIPNLLIPGICGAIDGSPAKRIYICNTMTQAGETSGFSFRQHVEAVERYLQRVDYVIVNNGMLPKNALEKCEENGIVPVRYRPQDLNGNRFVVMEEDVVDYNNCSKHDPSKLAAVIREIFEREE